MKRKLKNIEWLALILALLGIAGGIILYLIPKTPVIIIILLILLFFLFLYPMSTVWNYLPIQSLRWRKIGRIGSLILLIAGILIFGFCVWPDQLIITPDKLDLSTSDWGKTEIFEIENAERKTIYSIWVKIKGQNGDFNLDDIDIVPESSDEFLSQELGDINVNYATIIIKGLDANKKPCIYLLIYRLRSFESKFIKLRKGGSKQGENKSLLLVLSVVDSSRQAAKLASKDKSTAIQIRPPENLTIKSMSFLLKRRRN